MEASRRRTRTLRPSPSRTARRHLRAVANTPPPARCPYCRNTFDEWDVEVARVERRALDCRSCGTVLV